MKKEFFKSKLLIGLATLLAISLSIFIFNAIYQNELPKIVEEINNSAIGAIFTAIVTVFLLQGQTASEEDKERNVKVFEKKSELFNNFIEELWKVWEDRNISLEELNHLLKLVAKDIIPYAKPQSAKSILQSLNAIAVDTQNVNQNKTEIQAHLYAIINTLSKEIGLGGAIEHEVATELNKLENHILPYLNKKGYIHKINSLLQEKLDKTLTDFTVEDDILWWRVGGKDTGMWLRVGDTNNSGQIYLTFWSEFFSNRQYTPYRYAQKGESKDWIKGYKLSKTFNYNLLRKGEELSSESVEKLVNEIVAFYQEPLDGISKTIDELIEECNPQKEV